MHKKLSSSILSFLLVFSTFAFTIPHTGYAQTQQTVAADYAKQLRTIEEKADARRQQLGIPGVSLVIVKDDKIIFMKGLGYKDFEDKVPVTPDTQFAIGSATKAFTALSVLMSADEGKLSLDDPPKKYLPYFKMYDPETDKNIQIRDLMCHSSGLNRTDLAMITGKLNRAELIQVAAEAKPTAKLREKFQYQNIMFTAAGEIVSTVQKVPYDKLIENRIFKPLGMKDSTMSLNEMEKAKDYSFGYNYNFDTKETRRLPFRDIDQVAPAGSINSSARDMAQWLRFILNGGTVGGKRLVSEKGYSEWLSPQMKIAGSTSYGFGWFLRDWHGLKVVEHGGNIDGFNSEVAMIPEKRLGFVLLTNVSASSLGADLMPIVWSNILESDTPAADPKTADTANGGKMPAQTPAGSSTAARELIGKYATPAGVTAVEIKDSEGKVTFNIAGQQPYTLDERSKDAYSLSPLPEAYWLAPKCDAEGKVTSVVVTQPEGVFEFKKVASDATPKITAEELYQKALDAAGGEAAWRKLSTRVTEADIDLENQGVLATSTTYQKAPDLVATETTMTALGKTIATGWEYFDGTSGEEIYSFAPVEKYSGKRLDDARLGADFYGMLDWKTNYKKVEVIGTAKIGGEDAFIVSFEPEKGTAFREYYSTKSFLLLKRDGVVPSSTSSQQIPYTVLFSDYRDVDGIKIPFKTINNDISNGNIVTVIRSVKHNVPIDEKLFSPRKVN